jgi:hypothetical protein
MYELPQSPNYHQTVLTPYMFSPFQPYIWIRSETEIDMPPRTRAVRFRSRTEERVAFRGCSFLLRSGPASTKKPILVL